MEWNWKIRALMASAGIHEPAALTRAIKEGSPHLKRTITPGTIKRMLDGSLIEIKADGIIAICRYFNLQSIAELVDFDTAPAIQVTPWKQQVAVSIEFRLQTVIKDLHLHQNQVGEKANCSPVTINGLYHGRHSTLNFQVLKRIAEAIQSLSCEDSTTCRVRSITDLIEIVTEDATCNAKPNLTTTDARFCFQRSIG